MSIQSVTVRCDYPGCGAEFTSTMKDVHCGLPRKGWKPMGAMPQGSTWADECICGSHAGVTNNDYMALRSRESRRKQYEELRKEFDKSATVADLGEGK